MLITFIEVSVFVGYNKVQGQGYHGVGAVEAKAEEDKTKCLYRKNFCALRHEIFPISVSELY